jgi:hypothetical protein
VRVIVAGGRDFDDYQFMCARLDHFFSQLDKSKLVLINGDGPGDPGADQLAKRYARERNIPVKLFPPDWKGLGRAAGPIRNEQMITEGKAQALVAFNTGGRGTQNMIKLAEQYELKNIRVIDCPKLNQV